MIYSSEDRVNALVEEIVSLNPGEVIARTLFLAHEFFDAQDLHTLILIAYRNQTGAWVLQTMVHCEDVSDLKKCLTPNGFDYWGGANPDETGGYRVTASDEHFLRLSIGHILYSAHVHGDSIQDMKLDQERIDRLEEAQRVKELQAEEKVAA